MIETYYAGTYWLARRESAETCARRAERFFHLLGRCDPAWAHWRMTAGSFEEARKRAFAPNAESFHELFSSQEKRGDDEFSFHLWTGDSKEELSGVDAACGSADASLPSNCVLRPYKRGLIAERVLTAPVMTEVLRAMALAWDPEWGVVTSHRYDDLVSEKVMPAGTSVGWVMYFSRLRGTVPPLPAPVHIELVEDKGTLVTLTPERFTASNPEHVTLAARAHELLDRAGLLRSLQPCPTG